MLYAFLIESMTQEKYTVIDLFAGCGGLSLGLYQAGWHGVFAIEKSPLAFETLKYNLIVKKQHFSWPKWLPKTPLDIIDVNKKYKHELMSLRGTIDLVAGGPPCQGFSMAGKREENDIRNQLVFSYIDFIDMVRPKLILFENVKGFTFVFNKNGNSDSVPYSKIVTEKLSALGYALCPQIIDFSEYGVPQKRKRYILVGVLNGTEKLANSFLKRIEKKKKDFLKSKGLKEFCSVQEAISDLLKLNGLIETPDRKGFQSGIYGKIESAYQKFMRKGLKRDIITPNSHSFAHHGEKKIACFSKLLAEYPIRGKRIDGNIRQDWGIKQRGITILDSKSIAPTITNMPDDYIHYQEPRIMTVRECARIQSFPDWYEFKGKYTTGGQMRKKDVPRYSQVGNAIPPLFAELAGLVLKEMI